MAIELSIIRKALDIYFTLFNPLLQVVVKRFPTPAQTRRSFKVNNHPVNKRQSTDYEDYDDDMPSSSSRSRSKNLDSTIDKLLDSKEQF